MKRQTLLSGVVEFVMVAEHESFTVAARELGVSTSAVSHAVRVLERKAGVRLLVRSTNAIGLTSHGRALLETVGPAVRQTLAAIDRLACASAGNAKRGGRNANH